MTNQIFSSTIQIDSEDRYVTWLAHNLRGYVVNCLKTAKGANTKSDARFTRLHVVTCKSINPVISGRSISAFTTGRYQKLCSNDLQALETEAIALTGLKVIQRCPCFDRG